MAAKKTKAVPPLRDWSVTHNAQRNRKRLEVTIDASALDMLDELAKIHTAGNRSRLLEALITAHFPRKFTRIE